MSQRAVSANDTTKELTEKTRWVAPSFGDFSDFEKATVNKPPAKKFKRIQSAEILPYGSNCASSSGLTQGSAAPHPCAGSAIVSSTLTDRQSWVDKYEPQTISQLAIHPKKTESIVTWFKNALSGSLGSGPVLVVNGPPGSGKTAAVRVAAKELRCGIREWITPVSQNLYLEREDGSKKFDMGYVSERSQVHEFLFRASRYPNLLTSDKNERTVVLLEDLSNFFTRDTPAFHELLSDYAEYARSPLVIIVADDRIFRKLFPERILRELGISEISFNPIPKTILTKALLNIASLESKNPKNKNFQPVGKAEVEAIYEACCGDLRSAINTLQFTCVRGSHPAQRARVADFSGSRGNRGARKNSSKAKNLDKKESELVSIGGRDAHEDFFRSLGRVVYCKREGEEVNGRSARGATVHNPQDIVSSYHHTADSFTSFLHENYLGLFPNLDSVEKASEYLSIADTIISAWMDKGLSSRLGLSVAVQGLMYSNHGKVDRQWRPMVKPRSTVALSTYEERKMATRHVFPNSHCSSYELLSQLVPYVSKIKVYNTQAQQSFVENLSSWQYHDNSDTRNFVRPAGGPSAPQSSGVTPANGIRSLTEEGTAVLDAVETFIEEVVSD